MNTNTNTIAVIGASGFVGATFVERMLAEGSHRLRLFIRSSGNAWRLARHGSLKLESLDLLSRPDLAAALKGCTHVVNCSRGDEAVMFKGLENLLSASRAAKVERFVHLSSVAVYGDPPPRESVTEDAPTAPERGTYGWIKKRQDAMVTKAAAAGLPSVILCPPNISGAHSPYLMALVQTIRSGGLALVEEGSLPCNLVDVENLAHAIERALFCDRADAERLFVTDEGETTWRDVARALGPLGGKNGDTPTLTRDEAERATRPPRRPSGSVGKSLKHLVSPDVNQALRQDPYLQKIDGLLRLPVNALGKQSKSQVKRWVLGPTRVAQVGDPFPYDPIVCRTQLRGVRHSCARAKERIGYDPPLSTDASMELFRRWYRTAFGLETPAWDLLQDLYEG